MGHTKKSVSQARATHEPKAVVAPLTLENIQVYPIKEPMGKMRAFARLVLGGHLQLTGLKVIEGANGLFVAYPNEPSSKGNDYRSIYYPITKDLREHIEKAVLSEYSAVMSAQN